jgi:hypothetical protein
VHLHFFKPPLSPHADRDGRRLNAVNRAGLRTSGDVAPNNITKNTEIHINHNGREFQQKISMSGCTNDAARRLPPP